MLSYALRRIIVFVPTLFITLTLIFVLTRMLPGSPGIYPPPCHRAKSLNLWGYGQR